MDRRKSLFSSGSGSSSPTKPRQDSDLVVPQSRKSPFSYHMGSKPQANPVETSNNVAETIISDEEDGNIILRFSNMLKFYQLKYPHESKSTIALQVEEMLVANKDQKPIDVIKPLLQAYDEKLLHSKRLIKDLEKRLDEQEERFRSVISENEEYRKHDSLIEDLQKRVEVLLEENSLLVEEQRRNEPMIEGAFIMQKELESMKANSHLDQSEEVRKLRMENSSLLLQLKTQQDMTQSSKDEHKLVLDQLRARDKEISSTRDDHADMQERMNRIHKWHSNAKARMEEYDDCCQELGLSDWLPEFDQTLATSTDGILLRAIQKLRRDFVVAKKKLNEEIDQRQELTKAHTGLIQRYQIDLQKSEDTTRLMRDRFEELERSIDGLKSERDYSMAQCKEQAREIVSLRQKLTDYMRDFDTDSDRIAQKQKRQLDELQDQWTVERDQLQRQILNLKKSKVDMQCEIGFLLRDKRVTEVEVSQVLRNLDIQRDKFKRDVLGM